MFESVDTLDKDLRQFARDGYQLPALFRLSSSEAGKALLQLAAGKSVDALAGEPGIKEADAVSRRTAATRFVAGVMLAPGSDHFTTLGVSPDADSSVIRDNFRRLMALVHPDAQPVGFPSDAASRVNRAYTVLSEPGTRAAYAARELGLTPFGPIVLNAEPIPRRTGAAERESSASAKAGRFSGLLQTIRARQTLLWIAALLLLPLGTAFTSFLSYEPPQQLVQARPKPTPSAEMVLSRSTATSADLDSPPKTALDSRAAPAVEQVRSAAVSAPTNASAAESDLAGKNKTIDTLPLKQSAVLTEIVRSLEPTTASSPAAPLPAVVIGQSTTLTARRSSAQVAVDGGARPPSGSLAPLEPAQTVNPDASPSQVVPAVAMASGNPQTAAADRADAPRVKPVDAEAMVIRFSNAYEAGSISAFGQLFAPGMSSRRQMLNDYERVFSATRQRTIKFSQLKHAVLGDRLATSGYAVVTTTDQDNRIVTQRVFLEFEIGRDRGEPRIERLANYVIN